MYGRGPWGQEILREGQGGFLFGSGSQGHLPSTLHELSLLETNSVSFHFILFFNLCLEAWLNFAFGVLGGGAVHVQCPATCVCV